MSSESAIQRRAIAYAKTLGFLARRNYVRGGGETGWPDVEFYLPAGRTIQIEFKAPGEEPKRLQLHRIAKLRELGHEAYVCDTFEDARAVLMEAFVQLRSARAGRG